MIKRKKGAWRRMKNFASAMAIGTFVCLFSAIGTPTTAQTQISLLLTPMVVRNDRGGLLRDRLIELGKLRRSRRPVEISGAVCYSTCTMFLGLPQTCISPRTTFGFHGPSTFGRALDPTAFDRATRVIASYYPQPLRSWYLNTGRYKIKSMYKLKGQQIISMGIRAC